jgi:hypothetical protein
VVRRQSKANFNIQQNGPDADGYCDCFGNGEVVECGHAANGVILVQLRLLQNGTEQKS